MRVSWYKQNKYGNDKLYIAGKKFDSKRESKRYVDLLLMEKVKRIASPV